MARALERVAEGSAHGRTSIPTPGPAAGTRPARPDHRSAPEETRPRWAPPRSTPPAGPRSPAGGRGWPGRRWSPTPPPRSGEVHVEHLGLAEHRPEHGVDAPRRGRWPPRAATGGSHRAVRSRARVATPTPKPTRLPTRADSPNGVGRNRSATRPAPNPMVAPRAGPADDAGHDGQQDHDVGVDPAHPEVEHQGLLDGDEAGAPPARPGSASRDGHRAALTGSRRHGPPSRGRPHSTTDTYRRWARSASGCRAHRLLGGVAPVLEETTLATGMPAGIDGALEPAGGEHLAAGERGVGGHQVGGQGLARALAVEHGQRAGRTRSGPRPRTGRR